jgi:hypothetical protein
MSYAKGKQRGNRYMNAASKEVHYVDGFYDSNQQNNVNEVPFSGITAKDNKAFLFWVNNVLEGTQNYYRVGTTIMNRYILLDITIRPPKTILNLITPGEGTTKITPYIPFRIIVFVDHGANGTMLSSLNDLLTSFDLKGNALYSIESGYNTYNRGRFEILSNTYSGFWITDQNGGTPIPAQLHKQYFIDLRKRKLITKFIETSSKPSLKIPQFHKQNQQEYEKSATSTTTTGTLENTSTNHMHKQQQQQQQQQRQEQPWSSSSTPYGEDKVNLSVLDYYNKSSSHQNNHSSTSTPHSDTNTLHSSISTPPPIIDDSIQDYEEEEEQQQQQENQNPMILADNKTMNISTGAIYVALIPLLQTQNDVSGNLKELYHLIFNSRLAFV